MLRIKLLGSINVDFDSGTTRIPSRKSRTLLALLAIDAGRTVSLAAIVDELWSVGDTNGSRNAAHAAISRLRRAIPPHHRHVITTESSGYRLNLDPDEVDTHRFSNTLRDVRQIRTESPMLAVEILDSIGRVPAHGGAYLRCHRVHAHTLHVAS